MATKNIIPELTEYIRQNKPCALATVVKTSGSTPQVPGSSAIIGKDGLLSGTVGGGPAEYQVICRAQKALKSKIPEMISFDMKGIMSEGSDAVCGGQMAVVLDESPEKYLSVWEDVIESLTCHIPGILVTKVEELNNKILYINRLWLTSTVPPLQEIIPDQAVAAIDRMFESVVPGDFRSMTLASDQPGINYLVFAETIVPPPSLIIAGAGHVGKAVARLGKFLGFEVTVWDDRTEYASITNIPDADFLLNGTVEEGPGNLVINNDTYLVIVTRGHKNDAEVLKKWIHSDAAYIGMMGSRIKVAQMRQQFLEQGWATPEQWDGIFSPIGLKIGAKTVEEIAVSIAAELVQVKNAKA